MPDTKNQNTSSIWAWENTAPITKMGIEGTVALVSLAAAMTTILVATNVIAGPALLASVANPVGIAALFVAAVYFTAAAYFSYQQMHKNEEISGAGEAKAAAQKAVGEAARRAETAKGAAEAAKQAVEAKAESFVTKDDLSTELGKKLNSDKLKDNVTGLLKGPNSVLRDSDVSKLVKEIVQSTS